MARKYKVHLRKPGTFGGVACKSTTYIDVSRYVEHVTCKKCLAVHNKANQPKEAIKMARLEFVSEHDRYSTYTDGKGNEVHLAHDDQRVMVTLASLNVQEVWTTWNYTYEARNTRSSLKNTAFINHLKRMVIDPDNVTTVLSCGHCGLWHLAPEGGAVPVAEGYLVCDACMKVYYRECTFCHKLCGNGYDLNGEAGAAICRVCLANDYIHCRPCGLYLTPEQHAEGHKHDGSDCCDVPKEMVDFSVRNDGEPRLVNDTIVKVTLPEGVLTEEGRKEIARYIRAQARFTVDFNDQQKWVGLARSLHAIGEKWQTRDGNYPKRVSRYAHKQYGLKVSPEVISEIGNIGARHTVSVDFYLEVSRLLNESAKEWGTPDSCWWQSHIASRCALKSNGGFGIRTFATKEKGGIPTGRVWVIPLRLTNPGEKYSRYHMPKLVATFNTETPDAYAVFNGYNNLAGYAGPRLVAHMMGMTYRKVAMRMVPQGYFNDGSGYIVAPEEIAEHYTDAAYDLNIPTHADLFKSEQATQTNKFKDAVLEGIKSVTKKEQGYVAF